MCRASAFLGPVGVRMSEAGSCFHLFPVTTVDDGQKAELRSVVVKYLAKVYHGRDPDKIRRAIRECSYKLSRSS